MKDNSGDRPPSDQSLKEATSFPYCVQYYNQQYEQAITPLHNTHAKPLLRTRPLLYDSYNHHNLPPQHIQQSTTTTSTTTTTTTTTMSKHSKDSSQSKEKKKVWQDGEFEESIYLRDVFGGQYSFADDPSKRNLMQPKAAEAEETLRQRKPAAIVTERIRRPKSTVSVTQSEVSSRKSPSPPKRSRSDRQDQQQEQQQQQQQEPESTAVASSLPSEIEFNNEPESNLTPSVPTLPSLEASHQNQDIEDLEGQNDSHRNDDESNNDDDEQEEEEEEEEEEDEDEDEEEEQEEASHEYHSSQASSVFLDEPSLDKSSVMEDPLPRTSTRTTKKPRLIIESARRTWCIGCCLCWGIVGLFGIVNGISLLIFDPTPELILLNDTTLRNPTSSPTARPLFEPTVEQGMVGALPPETMETMALDPDSAPGMALRWMNADPDGNALSLPRRRQRFALAALYFATNPPFQHEWTEAGYWLSYDVSECQWLPNDNLCEAEDFVVNKLVLPNNNLRGELPLEVSLLQNLTNVDLQGNRGLSGTLPKEWCGIPDLQFDCRKEGGSGLCGCGDCPC
jgi:hypothetical protein